MKKILDSACITISGNLVNKNKTLIGILKRIFDNEYKS